MEAALTRSAQGGDALFAGDDPFSPPAPPVAALKAKVASKLHAYAATRPAPGAAPTGCSDEKERRAYVDELAAALSGARRRKRDVLAGWALPPKTAVPVAPVYSTSYAARKYSSVDYDV